MRFFTFFFTIAFLLSGIGEKASFWPHIFAMTYISIESLRMLFWKTRIVLPPGWIYLVLFLLAISCSLFWSNSFVNSLQFNLIFIEGAYFYFWAFNFGKKLDGSELLILIPFGLYCLGVVISKLTPVNLIPLFAMFYPDHVDRLHRHVGDLASLAILILSRDVFDKKVMLNLIPIAAGLGIMWLSNSRISVVMLVSGFYILFGNRMKPVLRYFVLGLGVMLLGTFFVYQDRSLLLSRPYFLQSLRGLLYYPLGVGMGNFELVSRQFSFHLLGYWDFSKYTHNLLLELLTGIGVFSLLFYGWFLICLGDIISLSKKRNALLFVIYILLTLNFMFDTTYTIPGMVWLWFYYTGFLQSKKLSRTKLYD